MSILAAELMHVHDRIEALERKLDHEKQLRAKAEATAAVLWLKLADFTAQLEALLTT